MASSNSTNAMLERLFGSESALEMFVVGLVAFGLLLFSAYVDQTVVSTASEFMGLLLTVGLGVQIANSGDPWEISSE